jgi:hypothetical protein
MSNRIKPRRSYTANAVPTTSDLEVNEIAINWEDNKAFTKNAAGNIVSVTLGGGGGSGLTWSSVPASATATGTAGQIAYDKFFQYTCVATNTWRRAAMSTWVNFVPTSITGLQIWLDASDASTLYDATSGGSLVAADGAVARWEDKSGNSRHATQSTSGYRPLRKTGVQGGKDALLWDGSASGLALPNTFGQWGSGNWTMFFAVKTGATVTSKYLFASVANPNDLFIWNIGNDMRVRTSGGSVQTFSPALVAATSSGVITSVTRNGSTFTGRVGSETNTATTTGSLSFNATNVELGVYNEPGFRGLFWNGHICEVIAWNSALSDADRIAAELYLKMKWDII